MATPSNAAYKVQQRDLRSRLTVATKPPKQAPATSATDVSRFWLGQHTNPKRKARRAIVIKEHGVRQWRRLQQGVRRLSLTLDPIADAARHYSARGTRADALSRAAKTLETEFVEAFYASPRMTLSTPGWSKPRMELWEVVYDCIGGVGNEDVLMGLLEVLRDAASGKADSAAAGARAWISKQAKRHGEQHASDMVDGDEE
jgi:hypothetical protein